MKKNKTILILIVIILGITVGAFYYFYTKNSNNGEQNNYEVTRTSTNENADINTNNNSNYNDGDDDATETNGNGNTTNKTNTEQQAPPTETTLATFSTKIYTKESARQNNINITCSSLNDTIVKAGETFSFCNTVGQATTAKGYQKADIFDKNGNKKKGLRWW